MIINSPSCDRIPALRGLWQQAFGDSDHFLDSFFATGFSPDRCRCMIQSGQLAAALYWFDCTWDGKKLAYLYAVATEKNHQGKGLCRALMENTHQHLHQQGYAGAVLVPGSEALFRLYEKLGYGCFGGIRTVSCSAATEPVALQPVTGSQYAALRRPYLPENSILQEGPILEFLSTQAHFYAGTDFLLCAIEEGDSLFAPELLGNTAAASGILAALGKPAGRFRTPGSAPFAMYRSLTDSHEAPAYFAFALD